MRLFKPSMPWGECIPNQLCQYGKEMKDCIWSAFQEIIPILSEYCMSCPPIIDWVLASNIIGMVCGIQISGLGQCHRKGPQYKYCRVDGKIFAPHIGYRYWMSIQISLWYQFKFYFIPWYSSIPLCIISRPSSTCILKQNIRPLQHVGTF